MRADGRQERLGVSPHWASESKMVTSSSSGSRVTVRPGPQHPLKPPQPEPKTQTERAPAAFPSSTQRALLHEIG